MPDPATSIATRPGLPWAWGTTSAELAADYPTSGMIDGRGLALHRAIDVDAAPDLLFRWVCQIKVAPYSYDLLDNLGRKSPPELTPGADRLAIGQRFMVFRIVSFEPGVHITSQVFRWAQPVFGKIPCTYVVVPRADGGSRLIVRFETETANPVRRLAAAPLAWIDLVMIRKQFLTIKRHAERDQRRADAAS